MRKSQFLPRGVDPIVRLGSARSPPEAAIAAAAPVREAVPVPARVAANALGVDPEMFVFSLA